MAQAPNAGSGRLVPAGNDALASSAKSVVLTGGAGRVGRAVRAELAHRLREVRIVDIADPGPLGANEGWQPTDINDLPALTKYVEGADAIVHLAGYPNERSIEELLRVNVHGTHNVYEAAKRAGIGRVVLGSSNHVVGFYPRDTRVGSDDPMRPDSLYGLSKCWGELEAGLYYEKVGIRSLIIRIGHVSKQPMDARDLAVWISARDLAQLVLIGLEHPDVECTTVYGVSRNDAAWWDNSVATALGYRPADCAADLVAPEALAQPPSPLPHIAEFFKGGRFCAFDHDGAERRRHVDAFTPTGLGRRI